MKDSFTLQLSLALGISAIFFIFLFSSVFDSTYVFGEVYNNSVSVISETFDGMVSDATKIKDGVISSLEVLVASTVNISIETTDYLNSFFVKKPESIEDEIENSFSDEIQISIDADGKTGIINPVFKKNGSENYLYVLMPSKTSEK